MARRRAEIAARVRRLRPTQRSALAEMLNAVSEAGGEPLGCRGDGEAHPFASGLT